MVGGILGNLGLLSATTKMNMGVLGLGMVVRVGLCVFHGIR